MSTLDNVETRGDGAPSPSAGLTPSISPKAESSQTGVSVKYVQHPDKHWYVIRATYERARQAHDYINGEDNDAQAYIAMHITRKTINGKRRTVKEPLIGNLLFVYCKEQQIEKYIRDTPALSYLRYYYDHCAQIGNGINPKMTVEFKQMMNFIRLTSIEDENIRKIDAEYVHYLSGDLVRITSGKFKNVVGRVARAAGQQRVIVELEGIALIATAYIPAACLEKVL